MANNTKSNKSDATQTTVEPVDLQAQIDAYLLEFTTEDVVITEHQREGINEAIARRVTKDNAITLQRDFGEYWQLSNVTPNVSDIDKMVFDVAVITFDVKGIREPKGYGYWQVSDNGSVNVMVFDEKSATFVPFTGLLSEREVSAQRKIAAIVGLLRVGSIRFGNWEKSVLPTNHLAQHLARYKMLKAHDEGRKRLTPEQFTNVNKHFDRNVRNYYIKRDADRLAKREQNERILNGVGIWS